MTPERHSSPSPIPSPPPVPKPQRTGSFPGIVDHAPESKVDRALRIALHVRDQQGHPPIEASGDPGAGMWRTLAEVRLMVLKVVAYVEAAEAAEKRRGGVAGRVLWRIVEVLIPLLIGYFLLYLSGFSRLPH